VLVSKGIERVIIPSEYPSSRVELARASQPETGYSSDIFHTHTLVKIYCQANQRHHTPANPVWEMEQPITQKLGRKDLPLIILGGVDSFRGLDGVSVGSVGTVQDVLVVREPVPTS